MEHTKLSRADASAAVTGLGWRYVLGEFRTEVLTGSLPLAADVAGRAAALPDVEGHLRMDIRADRLLLSLQTAEQAWVTTRDAELARQLSALAQEFRLTTRPGDERPRTAFRCWRSASTRWTSPVSGRSGRRCSATWRARPEGWNGLVDPLGQGPAVWFQQMDAPRPQRNRIHLDVSVPHDEAPRRIEATLAAGGTVRSDAEAPAFWVLADPEGNEACITTWQGRD